MPSNLTDSVLYKQFGNSVSVPLIKRIAEQIKIAMLDANHPPLEGGSKLQSNFGEGGKDLDKTLKFEFVARFYNPSPKASPSTLPQGEGDLHRIKTYKYYESRTNYKKN